MGEFCGWLQIIKFQVGNRSITMILSTKNMQPKINLLYNFYLYNNNKYSVSESTTPGIQKYAFI